MERGSITKGSVSAGDVVKLCCSVNGRRTTLVFSLTNMMLSLNDARAKDEVRQLFSSSLLLVP